MRSISRNNALRFSRGRARRRGSSYILVLAVALIVTVIGLTSISVARLGLRAIAADNDAREAEFLATSAVERALTLIDTTSTWRGDHVHNIPTPKIPLGRGDVQIKLVDEVDGKLLLGGNDPVRVYGIAQVGQTVRLSSVLLAPTGPRSCLEVAAQAGISIEISQGPVNCNQVISANDSIDALAGTTVNADGEAVNQITGAAQFTGSTTTGIAARTMPEVSTVFDYYLSHGTWIDMADIPVAASVHKIESVVLSPASNPYGAANAQGIYVVDCGGERLDIQVSRIVGTLVLLDPGPGSWVTDRVHWEPAVFNYPAVLVQGDIELHLESGTLMESFYHTNFNPVGTPYLGEHDDDNNDQYPTLLRGIAYASGDITVTADGPIEGVLIAGANLYVDSRTDLTYRSTFFQNPPPGFAGGTGPMSVVQGSWRWETGH